MGLLDKWTKRKEKQQLEAAQEKADGVVVDEKKESKQDDKKKEKKVKEVKSKKAEKKDDKNEKKVKKVKKQVKGDAYKVLIRPLISEKATMAESRSTYTFVVAKNANKIQIKNAIKQIYGIVPTKVRVMNVEGKKVRFGRHFGRRSDWKKAIISLPKGQTIDVHEGV